MLGLSTFVFKEVENTEKFRGDIFGSFRPCHNTCSRKHNQFSRGYFNHIRINQAQGWWGRVWVCMGKCACGCVWVRVLVKCGCTAFSTHDCFRHAMVLIWQYCRHHSHQGYWTGPGVVALRHPILKGIYRFWRRRKTIFQVKIMAIREVYVKCFIKVEEISWHTNILIQGCNFILNLYFVIGRSSWKKKGE